MKKKQGKNHKSTNIAMPNDGSNIKVIDPSQGD